jgi:hypothetical protein
LYFFSIKVRYNSKCDRTPERQIASQKKTVSPADRQTDRLAEMQLEIQACRQAGRDTKIQIDRKEDKRTDSRQKFRIANRETVRLRERQLEIWQAGRQID